MLGRCYNQVRYGLEALLEKDLGTRRDMLAWPLYGVGLENLGWDGQPVAVPVPVPGPGELLARVDAVGLCYSDLKIARLGANHPRLRGYDLATHPIIMGHEVALTVVSAGRGLSGQFQPGQRFAVQPDVYFQGTGMAYGYRLAGGLAEYSLIGREILRGDEGCYLVPIDADMGYAEAALTEPWGCVESSYTRRQRLGFKAGGRCLIVHGGGSVGAFDLSLPTAERPSEIVLAPMSDSLRDAVEAQVRRWEVRILSRLPEPDEHFDDVVVIAPSMADVVEQALNRLASHSVLTLLGSDPLDRPVAVDIGRVHYDYLNLVGSPVSVREAHSPERNRAELRAGGTALFLGAGGAIGRMHVERALRLDEPPAHVVCTNTHDERLEELEGDYGALARARGKRYSTFNPRGPSGPWGWEAEVVSSGFDDVVILASSPLAAEEAAQLLASGGRLSVFAGFATGTEARLDVSQVPRRGIRIVGSTGLTIADQRRVVERVRQGQLAPHHAVAAVGGLRAARDGLLAMTAGKYTGKIVIYPQVRDLPLMSVAEVARTIPHVGECLDEGRFWSRAAEAVFLSRLGGGW